MKLSNSSIGATGGILASLAGAHAAFAASDPVFVKPATAYVQASDSPFAFPLADLGRLFILENFEGVGVNAPGVSFSPSSSLLGPGPTTDSVDADDGAIDGLGTAGSCWRTPSAQITTINFDPGLLGGLPTKVGLVWTDGAAPQSITLTAFGPNGSFLGLQLYDVGDDLDGTTGDDRFIGLENLDGIESISVLQPLGATEVDHLQYNLPVPFRATFLDAAPYASTADSPFDIVTPGADHVVQDFEAGSFSTFGAIVSANFLVAPGAVTDSVDGDDGVLDGLGNDGWSIAQFANIPLVVTFDANELGGLPTEFGIVVTDVADGPKRFRLRGFDAQGTTVGFRDYTVVGDATANGTTAEDRIIAMVSDVGLSRVEITALDVSAEFDHIQFNVPALAELTFIDPAPYLSVADSPFDIAENPDLFTVVDLEDGTVNAYLATIDVDYVVAPGGSTDSVDGDDGAIDGSGNGGWSAAHLAGSPLVVAFDVSDPAALPMEFGVVVTDVAAGRHAFLLRGFDKDGVTLGQRTYQVVGDASGSGTTAEDRFIGFTSRVGIGRVELSSTTSGFELDHIQYDAAPPNFLTFVDPAPYLSLADSPFVGAADPGLFTVVDLENGTVDAYLATIDVDYVVAPGGSTDSVDGDDGAIDGNGNGGWSAAHLAGSPMVVAFDVTDPMELPVQFGVVVTDVAAGPQTFILRGFDKDGVSLGKRTYQVVGDDSGSGTTAEDRFLGFTSPVGIGRVELSSTTSGFELDHIQYSAAPPNFLVFVDPAPYLSVADSPFAGAADPAQFTVVDLEDGTVDAYLATIDVDYVVAPGGSTDSVDGDDGVIDGSGNGGWSAAHLAGSPVVVAFDVSDPLLLPVEFGVVVTDVAAGPHTFLLRGFDKDGVLLGQRTYQVVGDASGSGTTAEDRFIGFTSPVGIGRVELSSTTSGFELDHIQYNAASPPRDIFGDVNGDGIVDYGDLGSLLALWDTMDPGADITDDGIVDGADLGLLLAVLSKVG